MNRVLQVKDDRGFLGQRNERSPPFRRFNPRVKRYLPFERTKRSTGINRPSYREIFKFSISSLTVEYVEENFCKKIIILMGENTIIVIG